MKEPQLHAYSTIGTVLATAGVVIAVYFADVEGFSYQEIADTLGIGLSAVKMRIQRGRQAFRLRYGGGAEVQRPPGTHAP